MSYVIRIKPFNPRAGHKLRSLIDQATDKRYVENSLYTVTKEEAEYLAWFMQDGSRIDPNVVVYGAQRAFDVWESKDTARKVLDNEARAAMHQQNPDRLLAAQSSEASEAPVLAEDAIDTSPVGSFSDPLPGERPPTALERRNQAVAKASAARAKNKVQATP
jgi:hypothetical protein